ncbi:tumor necrosis factor receptor superfamily member 14-like isoform X2 [Hemibagrus wyckioides]|uniref:tumor necrosis factor receptor superfamily member 14-like isoform X1 n=2 Tax=Hemibagrus wyckioides TaxID=337641 RepID=UPI00266C691B|nr:tumor necrosis factor receptor superfamily member 14-like isoform X1 [Hemibagrus wyckioides]XP_058245651.1 tumor necrosis factor receptor superfamily member 14-like isoform X2 [Hemibagrus wyckioides]
MKCGGETFISFFLKRLFSTVRMVSSLNHAFIITTVLFLNIELCICTCARAEYEINGECCPMCPSGSRVFRHCTEVISTTCIQCVGSTYTDEPNGLPSCISCTVCDAGQGLRVKASCTHTSDTVCEPLEGFHCIEEYRGGCRYAVEHTKCSPGQYIKQNGTALKDTECAGCAKGTYSNGSLHICKQHSKCEDLGLTEITKGTNSLDAECGKKTPVALIVGVILAAVILVGALTFAIRKYQSRDGITKKIGHKPHKERNMSSKNSPSPYPSECLRFLKCPVACLYFVAGWTGKMNLRHLKNKTLARYLCCPHIWK